MHRYIKGARSERELLNKFYGLGYSVLRSAGSGVNSLGPDIIAIKDRLCLSFECKAWEKNRLSIELDGYMKLAAWEKNTKFPTYIAWRMNQKGWFFIKLEELKQGEKDYSITKKRTLEINRLFEAIIKHDGENTVQAVAGINGKYVEKASNLDSGDLVAGIQKD